MAARQSRSVRRDGKPAADGWRPDAGRLRGSLVDANDLISRAKRGDNAAIAQLYDDHATMVYGYLRANGSRKPEDLTGDVFVGMLSSINDFEGNEDQFKSWLMTIAYRRLTDERRRFGRRPIEHSLESVRGLYSKQKSGGTASPTDSHLRIVDSHSSGDSAGHMVDTELVEAMRTLTDDQRQIVGLRFVADLSLEDVAEITGKSVTAVKAMQRRALDSLRRQLEQK